MRLDIDPNDMTPGDRVMELQEILARGLVRAQLISGTRGPHSGQKDLTARGYVVKRISRSYALSNVMSQVPFQSPHSRSKRT